jgi:starch synthase
MQKKMKVLMMAAEVSPFVKVGGLADVVGSLPKAVKKLKCDVRVVMPLYDVINRRKFKLKKIATGIDVPSGMGLEKVNVWESVLPGSKVKIYFIECDKYFKGGAYAGKRDSAKFLFFSYAALFVTPVIKFIPDVVHCHDSHTAMVPDIIKKTNYEFLKNIKTLYTIHNFRYQGKTGVDVLSTGNLSKTALKSLEIDARDNNINYTVQGVLNADIVNTVSVTYAKEILTKEYGEGLESIIRKRRKDLYGIVNGIDLDSFDPARDKSIVKKYSVKTIKNKDANKVALQKKLGLSVDANIPMVGMVTRFAKQKGLKLFTEKFAKLDCQFVFLGTGQKEYEQHISSIAKKYPDKVSANILFDIDLARQIYAASDMFLMQSAFEPCGLGQMIAMRYGTVTIARATGGLDDTVDETVGFKFKKFLVSEFYNTLKRAVDTYHDEPKKWAELRENCMKRDFSWDKSAKEYVKLYRKCLSRR